MEIFKKPLKNLKMPDSLHSWQLMLALAIVLFLVATGLRFDHLTLDRLKTAVKKADASGEIAEINKSVEDLRKFASTHTVISLTEENGRTIIHFGTGPIYLEHQYTKAASAELEKAKNQAAQAGGERNIYAEASAVCQPQAIRNHWAWNSKPYINCMMGELAKHPASPEVSNLFSAALPSSNAYRINYASPLWAPSFVGWTMVIAAILAIALGLRLLYIFGLFAIITIIRLKNHNFRHKNNKRP